MSTLPDDVGLPPGETLAPPIAAPTKSVSIGSVSPGRRVWERFKRQRLGYYSLLILASMLAISLLAELLSNDKPLLIRYNGEWYVPIVQTLSEADLGGELRTEADYHDPFVQQQLAAPGNFALFTFNRWG